MKYNGKEVSEPNHYIYTIIDNGNIYVYETNYLSNHICDNIIKKEINPANIKIYTINEMYINLYYKKKKLIGKKRKIEEEEKIEKIEKIEKKSIIEEIQIGLGKDIKYKFSKRMCSIKIKLTKENEILIENIINKLEKENYDGLENGKNNFSRNQILIKRDEKLINKMILRAEKRLEKKKNGTAVNYVINKYVDYDTDEINKSGNGSDGYDISDYDSDTKIKYSWITTGIFHGRVEYYY